MPALLILRDVRSYCSVETRTFRIIESHRETGTVNDETQTEEVGETRFEFQAEVSRLLELMVHSVYTEKEIFLRELISNASDACDKLRYAAITEPDLLGEDSELQIKITADADAKVLTISDNGIGMDRQELIENLGTIARSGTKAFVEQLKQDEDSNALIGQFGVGFYSAFMVADSIEVISSKAGQSERHIWQSDGSGNFSVTPSDSDTPVRGTEIRLKLKEDAQSFLETVEIERIVHQYSDHIPFPVMLIATAEDEDGKIPEPKKLNSASALWTRPKSEITEGDYTQFYRHVSVAFDDPAVTIHYRAEGRHEYTVLLFIPTMRPFDLFDPQRSGKVRLYVKRVYITDDAELLPAYLRFVRGVIDSEDMPLNISREMLQNNPIVQSIRKAVTGRVLTELTKFAEKNSEAYEEFWEAFGAVLKEGLYEDSERRDALYELARFNSTHGDGLRSLKSYVEDMRENQTAIYYLTGDSPSQLAVSPQLEGFKQRDVEVLLLADAVDNFWVTTALGYDGKPFKSITQGDADISSIPLKEGATEQEESPDKTALAAALIGRLKSEFGDAVSDVKMSTRLVDSPACLVAPEGGPDRGLDKLLTMQDRGSNQAPIIEINPNHRFVEALTTWSNENNEDKFKDLAWLLLDEARILEGALPEDPAQFSERMNRLILSGL